MTSIFQRLDDLIRGSLHRFVDRALENNSLILYDQDVRDMEEAIAYVEEAAATMYAAARANERRLTRHQEDVELLERRLEQLTEQGAEPMSERMMVAQAELEARQELVVETQAQIERQQAQYETLKKKVAETELLKATLKDARPRLESLLVLARAYRSVERVELTLEGLRGLAGDTEIAMVANSIYQRFNETQARLDAMYRAEDLEIVAELEQIEVEDQLDERRRRLGLEHEPEPEATVPSTDASDPSTPEAPAPEPPPDVVEPRPDDEPPALAG